MPAPETSSWAPADPTAAILARIDVGRVLDQTRGTLSEHEWTIQRMRCLDGEEHTLEETGRVVGLTSERVR